MYKKMDLRKSLIETIENLLNKGRNYAIVTTNKNYLPKGIDIMARKAMPPYSIYVVFFKIKKECETEQEALSKLDRAIEYEKIRYYETIDGVLISPLKKDYKLTLFKRVEPDY